MIKCALIGDPVEGSISHITHNYIFSLLGELPCFRKIHVDMNASLDDELWRLQEEGYQYLAVTMPHKRNVLSYVSFADEYVEKIGAVNWIDLTKRIGYNTDGIGAWDAVSEYAKVVGQCVCVIGGGGCARALLVEGQRRGVKMFVLCRKKEQEELLCQELGCNPCDYKQTYDGLMHATPVGMQGYNKMWDVALPKVCCRGWGLDTVYPSRGAPFLQYVEKCCARPIFGEEMFVYMAHRQFTIAFGHKIKKQLVLKHLKKIVRLTRKIKQS